ncbi:MAG: phospholipase [Acidimicrobiia bacterium]
MAILANLVVAATTFLAASALPAPDVMDPSSVAQLTFDVGIGTFTSARVAHTPAALDWSSDGCSTPLPVGLGDTGRSYNFRAACQRHDFGYRNHKLLDRRAGEHGWWWNETTRRRIDDRFLADMVASCTSRPWTQRASCRAWAQVYYRAVRLAGSR